MKPQRIERKRPKTLKNKHRCVFCGRFFWTPQPESDACDDHLYDWNRQQEEARREGAR